MLVSSDSWRVCLSLCLSLSYIPVYVIPLLLFRARRLLASPAAVCWRLLLSVCRSSLFLSLYCSVGWAWMCLLRHADTEAGRQSHAVVSGLLSGLCVLVEKQDRRLELSLYVLSQALWAAHQLLVDCRLIRYRPDMMTAALAAALTVLLTAFEHDLDAAEQQQQQPAQPQPQPQQKAWLRPSYCSLFSYFLGHRRRVKATAA